MNIVFLLILLIFSPSLFAATINAASCSNTDVQAAINSAVDGDIVNVPAGTCTWGATVNITDKGITLNGGGSYSVDVNYNDTGTWPVTINRSGSAISISGTSTSLVRITGFRFTGSNSGGTSGVGAIVIAAGAFLNNWRIDNSRFEVSGNAIHSNGSYGVIDHIYSFGSCSNYDSPITAFDRRNSFEGNWAFTQPVDFGTSKFVFIEDSTFWRNCIDNGSAATVVFDAQVGGRVVFRHNYVRDAMAVWHGTESGAPERGGYAFEIYNNTFYWQMDYWRYHTAIFVRGGTALIFNNHFTNYSSMWKSDARRADTAFGVFGRCDGTQVHDGNAGTPNAPGHPCLDQVGTGQATGSTLATVQPQEVFKLRAWSNTLVNTGAVAHNQPLYVVEGRDYEYSVDDSAKLAGYTEYTYPHPLTGGGSAPVQLSVPQNLRFIMQ